jgi:hypothetical protein
MSKTIETIEVCNCDNCGGRIEGEPKSCLLCGEHLCELCSDGIAIYLMFSPEQTTLKKGFAYLDTVTVRPMWTPCLKCLKKIAKLRPKYERKIGSILKDMVREMARECAK